MTATRGSQAVVWVVMLAWLVGGIASADDGGDSPAPGTGEQAPVPDAAIPVESLTEGRDGPEEPAAIGDGLGAAGAGELAMGDPGGELLLWENIPVVVTASRREEPIDMAPNIMYVVTKEEIQTYGYKRPIDVLVRIPGFSAMYSQNIQQYLLQVRGASFGENIKIAFMINGHRINNVNEDSSGVWPFTLENVERIEVIVGPGSVMYGADTLLATFNMITRRTEGFEATYSAGVGEFCKKFSTDDEVSVTSFRQAADVMWGHKWEEDKWVFLSGTFAENDGWFTYLNGNPDKPDPRPMGRVRPSYKVFANGQYGDWYFQYHRLVQEIGGWKKLRGNYVDSVVVRYDHGFNDSFSVNAEASFDHRRMTRRDSFKWRNYLWKAETGIRYQDDAHDFQMGVQTSISEDQGSIFRFYGEDEPAVAGDEIIVVGAYVSEKYRVNDKLSLVGAARFDRSNTTQPGDIFCSPRAAIIFKPMDKWILKAMYNTAIQYPDPAHSEVAIFGNKDRGYTRWSAGYLADKPESMTAYELQSIHYIGPSRLSINWFYQELNEVIAWYKPWTNMADLDGTGVELDFKWPVNDRFTVWANGSYQRTRIDVKQPEYTGIHYATPDDEQVVGVPTWMANLGFDVAVTEDITATATVRYLGDMPYRRQWWAAKNMSYREKSRWDRVQDKVYVDVTILWEDFLTENLDLSVAGKNILNNRDLLPRQREKGDYAPEGTSILGSVTYSW